MGSRSTSTVFFSFSASLFFLSSLPDDAGVGVAFAPLAPADRGPFAAAALVVDGARDDRWRVDVEALDDDHFAAVCRGPPSEAVDARGDFAATFGARDAGKRLTPAWTRVLDERRARFATRIVADLVPDDARADLFAVRAAAAAGPFDDAPEERATASLWVDPPTI